MDLAEFGLNVYSWICHFLGPQICKFSLGWNLCDGLVAIKFSRVYRGKNNNVADTIKYPAKMVFPLMNLLK